MASRIAVLDTVLEVSKHEYCWCVGTTALRASGLLPQATPKDVDAFLCNQSLLMLLPELDRALGEDHEATYFDGARWPKAGLDLWTDIPSDYLMQVPIPVLRIVYRYPDGLTLVGDNFHRDLCGRIVNVELREGSRVSPRLPDKIVGMCNLAGWKMGVEARCLASMGRKDENGGL